MTYFDEINKFINSKREEIKSEHSSLYIIYLREMMGMILDDKYLWELTTFLGDSENDFSVLTPREKTSDQSHPIFELNFP